MKKKDIMKKGAVLTLAAVMAFGLYSPAAVFAAEGSEGETPAIENQVAPPAEKQIDAVAPQTETKQEAQTVKEEEPAAVEEQAPVAEESAYGTQTSWGYGNESKTTKWVEYTDKDGKSTLVFSTIGDENTDEENAVTKLLDENGESAKEALKSRVSTIIFETGITGIGWTALYDKTGFAPLYGEGYSVDRSKTDLFNGFSKLTTVIPCETVKRIGWSAFRKCYALNNFDFSKCTGLEEIMNQAFSECHSLNTVDLTNCNALETIAWGAFNNAGRGTNASLTLPAEGVLAVIGGKAFLNFASKSTNGAVDFTPVACTVTKILQEAFSGTRISGEIAGFEKLEVLGDKALGAYISYVAYVPPVEEETPAVEEEVPAAQEEITPAAEEEIIPAAEKEVLSAVEEEILPAVESEVLPVIEDVVAPIIQAENSTATATVNTAKAAASNKAAAGNAVISDSTAPATAPAAASISDNSVAMTAPAAVDQSGSSLGYVLGGLAAALLMAMAAFITIRRRNVITE